jgi:hypothetical protein
VARDPGTTPKVQRQRKQVSPETCDIGVWRRGERQPFSRQVGKAQSSLPTLQPAPVNRQTGASDAAHGPALKSRVGQGRVGGIEKTLVFVPMC